MKFEPQNRSFVQFSKYSGCGNDFIVIDNCSSKISLSVMQIRRLCSRKTGIGADGIILIESSTKAHFKMRIFNADGSEAEMCGNGIRCMVDFLVHRGFVKNSCTIESLKLVHEAHCEAGKITVSMGEPTDILWDILLTIDSQSVPMSHLDTGVPHAVIFRGDCRAMDVTPIGSAIRHHPQFSPKGTNVNFVELGKDHILVRTYERGVEAETEACGTGATAAAVVAAKKHQLVPPITVKFLSGESLTINFKIDDSRISNLTMSGSCQHIFDGIIEL